MDPEIEVIEDPYMGLRLQAWKVQQLQYCTAQRRLAIAKLPPIRGGQVGLLMSLEDFLNTIAGYLNPQNWWNWLYSQTIVPLQNWWGQGVMPWIINQLYRIQGALTGWWEGAITRLTNIIRYISDRIRGIIDAASAALRTRLTNLFNALNSRIEAIRNIISAKISDLITRIRESIANLRAMISERIQTLIARIVDQGRKLRERLTAIFSNLWERITTSLRQLRERVWEAIMEGVRRLHEALDRHFRNLYTMVITAIRQWWRQAGPQILDAAERAITLARPHIERWVGEFQKLPARFLEYVATGAGTDLALQPSRALSVAGTLYTTSLLAGSLAMTTATALNLIPATNWVGAQQFAAYISEAAGFEPITRATYGVLLNECLAWPLRYHWNIMLRPKIPTEGTVFLMGRKRGLDRAEFGSAMAYHGIPDWWIDKVYQFFWTDPSPYWLLRMSEAATPTITPSELFRPWLEKWLPGWANDPFAWYKMKLLLAGFEDTDIPAFIEGFQRRRLMSPITQFKTSVRAMLREGYWLQAQAEEALTPLRVQAEEIALIVAAEELDYQKRWNDEQIRIYKDAFGKEEMDAADLQVAISTIIMKPERVAQIVTREQIRKLPKPKPVAAPKEDPEVAKIRSTTVQAHILMFRKRFIEARQLYNYLLADGLSEALARVTTIKELTSRIKAPPLDSPYFLSKSLQLLLREKIVEYDDLFEEGEITVGQYLHALRALGIDEDTAIYLADVARLRKFLGELPSSSRAIELL